MEKREPSLVPEWLRSSGNGSGVGNKSHIQSSSARSGDPDAVKISSSDLSLAVQSLSVGDSGITAGEGWASAPAEVPNDIKKSGSDSDITSNTLTGQTRNMAEALLQPPRTGAFPQGYSMIKRLEDQALKLIPVVPSAPKGSVSMTKPMVRSGAVGLASFRNTHKHSSMLLGNIHSNYGKPDSKLVILNPAGKESGGPSRITNSVAAGFQMIAAPSAPFITSVAQTQSRNAFYSALKKKTSTNISTSSCIFPSVEEKSDISKELVASNPSSVHAAERDGGFEPADLPDEEEAEFLKSLGWDENNTEVEALTDEEIRAFYEQHKKLKPSLMKKLPIIKEATEDATLSS
ncbi:PREDICTED: uncharacterized protein LOC106330022 [Brassica oleracea var. oleracea]|uniref:Uncharacterized protein n=1 Tax=Brassica oleracea var. oleracea TaxID=109376 RepID=A0A0D3B7U3_BRAOL|nr:PREDICTED: uncharacterized protein LOC106330020 [Brassica oleracea var. oleracea]XP_013624043.1 PREDICTED: uncharacterized protein LOC106330022 [Brassica oleracea var. oleracea]